MDWLFGPQCENKKIVRILTLNAEPIVVIRGEDVTVVEDGDFRATAVAEAEPRIEAKGVYLGSSGIGKYRVEQN